jgi:CheY-like chemotaxis protein
MVPFGTALPGRVAVARPLSPAEVRSALQPQPRSTDRLLPTQPVPERRLRVLLAEDNAINATLARRLVERAGHEVVHVWDGKAAVAAVAAGAPFDLALMDLQMPELDGLEATRSIRAEEGAARHLPIFAMTANAMPSDEEQCLAAGMDGFISKPVDVAHLRRVLESVVLREAA